MSEQKKRKFFSLSNKYQRQILLLSVAPQLLITIGMTAFVLFVTSQINDTYDHQSYALWTQTLAEWFSKAFYFLIGMIILSLIYSYHISQRIVGPFERIMRELDEILSNHQKKEIKVRPGDELAKELLKRINQLIKRMGNE